MSSPIEAALSSRARRVTLFEDRAEVVREAEVSLSAGTRVVAIGGVSPFVDERSVQARASLPGGAEGDPPRVLSARVRWRAHEEKERGREAIDALEAEARTAAARAREAEDAGERAAADKARADGLRARWIEAAGAVPRGARREEVASAFGASLAEIDRAIDSSLAAAAAAREAGARAEDDRARAEARLQAASTESPRYEAHVEVELSASAGGPALIEITYRVPCALWRPEHLVRLPGPLPAQGSAAPLQVVTLATAWQRTGEVWDDVEVRFSTARPARDASPPLLADDALTSRRKTDWERHRVEVSLREQAVALAGLDRGTRAVDEMPGVDDGGEPLLFSPKGSVSLTSDGRPFRVEVARATLNATIERVIFPEVAGVAHLRATATLAEAGPLLAGPARIARGQSLVGLAKLDFVGKGEPFEIGLGADDGLRVRRAVTEERETAAVLGTQRIRRKVEIFLVNLSDEPRRALVTERVPVSEIEDVEITLTDAGGFKPEGKDGFLRREVDLAAHATLELSLAYEIRAGSKVVLPS